MTVSRNPGGGASQVYLIANNYLVVVDDRGQRLPQLAARLISIADGSWVANADGTMTTTWTLRPDERWQDGVPFTSNDLVFSYTVYKDLDIPFSPAVVPGSSAATLQAMSSVEAPDPLTFVVHWSSVYADADLAPNLVPLPRHLLEEAYQNDKASLVNSPLFRSEFVGLGPYALTAWEPGVEMVFKRFDGYYQGRPPLDRIVAKIIGDPNTMVANILSGSVDVVLPLGVGIDEARSLEERWAGTRNRVIISPTGGVNFLMFQFRAEYARPANAMIQPLVRQALAYATDRAAVASIGSGGASSAADSWFPPTSQLHAETADSVPNIPFDTNLAQRRLAEAGWTLRPNRELRSESTGERFDIEIRAAPVNSGDKTTAYTASTWQSVGAQVQAVVVPPAQATNAEYRATFPGVQISGNSTENFYSTFLDSRNTSSPDNRWVGSNTSGYKDQTVDNLYRSIFSTIDPDARLALHRDLLTRVLGDAVIVPLWWTHAPTLVVGSVHGVRGLMHGSNAWNVFEWTKD